MNPLYKEDGERYFAASNTKDGFVSLFDEIFSEEECDKVYILKGGPGCGKSTFMKKLGEKAEETGLDCEYFHCSSDPSSLDGVIIKKKRVAVIDGTSPHAAEPRLAGAREIIIDLGKSWDTDKLYDKKTELTELLQKKKTAYSDCYRFLNAKHVMTGLVYNLVFPCILFDKLDKSTARLSKSVLKNTKKKGAGTVKTRLTSAVSSIGKVRFFTFEKKADLCIFLKEPYKDSRLSGIFMRSMLDYARLNKNDVLVSFNPENKTEIDALYFPETKTSVSLYDEDFVAQCDRNFKKCKIVNCAKFINMKSFSPLKPLRKFYSKLAESMEKQALESISKAGSIHAETEKIYRLCTNYKTVEKITNEYFKKILPM